MDRLPDIPGYQLQYLLGEGGMAKVYFGVQTRLKRRVAVKVMEGFLLKDENFSRRFLKEAETAANLNHPNIVTIYDVGQAGDSYYMVMEYLDGTLKDRIKRARDEGGNGLDDAEAVRVLGAMALALEYAHNQGYIHRDIKPDNIMFRNGGTPVLVDFGIAKAIGTTTKLTKTGMSIGTPHYMSPEQIRGQEVDGRADLYSLGVLFYEMLTGDVPYKATDYIAVVMKHLNEPVPPLPAKSARYQPLLERMMAKEKEHRFQSGSELIQELKSLETAPLRSKAPPVEPTVISPVSEEIVKSADFRAQRKREKKPTRTRKTAAILVVFLALTTTALMVVLQPWKSNPPVQARTNGPETQTPEATTEGPGLQKGSLIIRNDSDAGRETRKDQVTDPAQSDNGGAKDPPPEQKGDGELSDAAAAGDHVKSGPESMPATEPPAGKTDSKNRGKEPQSPPARTGKTETKIAGKEPQPDPASSETPRSRPPAVKQQPRATTPVPATVKMMSVSTAMVRNYIGSMDRIVVNQLPRKVKVMGTMTLELNIEADGNLRVVKALDSNVVVIPKARAPMVRRLVLQKLNAVRLAPPKDKQGHSVRVEDWRLTYSVGSYEGRIILKRRF